MPSAPAVKIPAVELDPPLTAHDIRVFWGQSGVWIERHYLNILIAAGIGTAIVLAMVGIRHLGARLCRTDPSGRTWRTILGRVIERTGLWFMVLFAARLVIGYAHAPELVQTTIKILYTIAAALQGALWVRELLLGFIEHRAGPDGQGAIGSAMGIIRLLVSVVLFAIATVLILDNIGVNVTGLIAGLGIGGIGIGLAAQGIFSDLFAALSIIFDKPFRRGDVIQWDKTTGTVEAIGLKTTRVRSVNGEEVVISNANLLGKELHNLARLQRRRHTLVLGVTYQTPPDVCAAIPAMVKACVDSVEKCKLVRCSLGNFGASSLDFDFLFDVLSKNADVSFAARHQVLIAILRRFNEEGIEFAYPTQVSIAAGADGRPVGAAADVATEPDGVAPAV